MRHDSQASVLARNLATPCFDREPKVRVTTYVVNRYDSYDVLGTGYKYIHCDLIDCEGYMTMTLIFGSYFAISFSLHLNSRGFVRFGNFGVTFHNKFERGDWGLVVRVGVSTIIEHIDPFPLLLCFVPTHTM
jgi:hypothetical protein